MSDGSVEEGVTDWGRARFRVDVGDGHVLVTASGEVDVRTAVGLGRAVRAAASRPSRLIIDLTLVTFIDSTGLGVLISARNQAEANGGSVTLVHPPELVRRILAGTHLQQSFAVFDDLDQALRAQPAAGDGRPDAR